ncbi:MAG: hypothetical protein ACE149_01365 [Armatimonadota bacterium]
MRLHLQLPLAIIFVSLAVLGPPAVAEDEAQPKPPVTADATITISPHQWGVSTRYIGGTEGSARFNIADLTGCGLNTLRIYGDMSRFEPADDDGAYGSPAIADIKADPNIIPWKRWDEVMDSPYSPHLPDPSKVTWRTVFADLSKAGICTVISLRNRDTNLNPSWMAAVPTTEEDWNEWWEYVFAIGYWLNVRNNYRVDDYEVLNEPDNAPQQGWLGTRQQYCEMIRRTKEALDYLYLTYLPGRTYHLHAPVTAATEWVPGVLADAGDSFDSFNIHWYAWWDKGGFVRTMHARLAESGHPDYPIWLSEWGTYDVSYDIWYMPLAVVENLIRFSQPGDDHVYGSHLFSFYDWIYEGNPGWGIVKGDGSRLATYYALRLANRALAGAKPTFEARIEEPTSQQVEESGKPADPSLHAIATKNPDGSLNLLVLNWSDNITYNLRADLSGLCRASVPTPAEKLAGTIRLFNTDVRDEIIGQTTIQDGSSRFSLPPRSIILVTYPAAPPP